MGKQRAECARILIVSDAVLNTKSLYKLLRRLLLRYSYSEHCQTFKMECFTKRRMPECRCVIRNFPGLGEAGFVELGLFDKYFVKNARARGPARKRVFSPRYS